MENPHVNSQTRVGRGVQLSSSYFEAALTWARTSSAWPSGLTLLKMWAILPSGPIRNVVRSMPMTFFPYMFFSLMTPKALQTVLSASASKV